MSKILAVKAHQILDSRGNPTIECTIKTEKGTYTASVPSGASTGTHEAHELRDGGNAYLGLGVTKAVQNINSIIAKKIKGQKPRQQQIDELMIKLDSTHDKRKLGANATLAVSMAVTRAEAKEKELPLYEQIRQLSGTKKITIPIPSLNIINGGKHAGNQINIQEHMIMPTGAKNFANALQISTETYQTLKKRLLHDYGKNSINVGDEGGFAPQMNCTNEPLDYITDIVMKLGYWKKIKLAIDCAATTYWKGKEYYLEGKEYTTEQLTKLYEELVENYPLISIEDPYYEEDYENFAKLTHKLKDTQIVGDDLLCTNPARIKKAIQMKSCNCLLLKINQIGTITEALQASQLAKQAGWKIMVSHRSGETTDDYIADLAVGLGAGQIKAGAPARGERTAKYNRLLKIEQETGAKYGLP